MSKGPHLSLESKGCVSVSTGEESPGTRLTTPLRPFLPSGSLERNGNDCDCVFLDK